MNNGTGRIWAVNANGGDEGRPNGVGPVYIENIDKIGGGVPDPSSASTGDVLTVDSQGNPAWEPPTGGGGGSYTAGNGIEIKNNQISVDTDVVATKSDLPDMSEYATESELTSGLAAKQDVISDLATIRSGASLGSTAVQPAALDDYATTTALTEGLAAKQDIISDLSTIRSGAQAGATAVQPAALDDYATTSALASGLATKQDTLTAGSNITISNGTISAVDTTYTAGANITIENGVISATDGDTRYSAGNGIDIDANNEISVDTTVIATKTDLASKQDTISDLATIRSGATLGATAVQPGSLATVATTGAYSDLSDTPTIPTVDQSYDAGSTNAMSGVAVAAAIANNIDQTYDSTSPLAQSGTAVAGALATKQDVISDLSTIRSGAQAGATAVQPGSLATVATSGNYNDLSNRPTIPAVDQTYNASSANAQSGTAVAGALASYTPTSSMATVATTGDYADLLHKPTIPTVPDTKPVVAGSNVTITENANDITISATDTTYSAGTGISISSGTISNSDPLPSHTSTESGKVLGVDSNGDLGWVNQSGGGTTYSAGDGIDITSGEISVAYDQNTLDVAATSTTASISSVSAYSLNINLPSDVASMISSLMAGGPSVTMTIPSDSLINQRGSEDNAFLMLSTGYIPSVNDSVILKSPLAYSERTEEGVSLDGQTVTLPVVDSTNWYIGSSITASSQFRTMAIMFGTGDGSSVSISFGEGFSSESSTLDPPMTFTQLGAPLLTVSNPLPACTSSDADKILTVNSSGTAAWATPSGGGSNVEIIDVTISTDAQTLWNTVMDAYNAEKLVVLRTNYELSAVQNKCRYWVLSKYDSLGASRRMFVFENNEIVVESGGSTLSYIHREFKVCIVAGSYITGCMEHQIATNVSESKFNPFTA